MKISDDIRKQVIELRWKEHHSMKTIADIVGISSTTVSKILREDKANPDLSEITELDKRLEEIEREQTKLEFEKDTIHKRRYSLFKNFKNKTIEFAIYKDDESSWLYSCKIFINLNNYEHILYEGKLYKEYPDSYDKERANVLGTSLENDFETVWHVAYTAIQQEKKCQKEQEEQKWEERKQQFEKESNEWAKQFNDVLRHSQCNISEQSKRQIINVLLKIFHPDKLGQEVRYKNTNPEIIRDILELKEYLLQ